MEWNQRMEKLVQWGKSIQNKDWAPYYRKIELANPWFTPENVRLALNGILRYLDPVKLHRWQGSYDFSSVVPKNIGVVMAGNIPLVGVHDLICCYLSGHRATIKPSSQDNILINLLIAQFANIDVDLHHKIRIVSGLEASGFDAILATGSDNTSRYFKYYFGKIPGIIRNSRTSVAVIKGNENTSQLQGLGNDIYSYFGRGCRNVSKLMVPATYEFGELIACHGKYRDLLHNIKYRNNYQYQKALGLTQGQNPVDTGFSLIAHSQSLVSPLSVLYFDYYNDQSQLQDTLSAQNDKIQCIASADGWFNGSLPFGSLQYPDLWDYADGIDTMDFLLGL